jgi:transposase InsO family protein
MSFSRSFVSIGIPLQQRHGRYGSPRVRETLRQDYGKRVSLKRVAQLMRENGLNARRKKQFIPTTNSNHGLPVCESWLNREFQAAGAKRVSAYQRYAITYLWTLGGWIYLTVVLDLYDRKIIAWAFSSDMETAHTTLPACGWPFTMELFKVDLIFLCDTNRAQVFIRDRQELSMCDILFQEVLCLNL